MRKLEGNFERLNTRITPEQSTFIKSYSKEKNITEGQVLRDALDYFIKKNKSK